MKSVLVHFVTEDEVCSPKLSLKPYLTCKSVQEMLVFFLFTHSRIKIDKSKCSAVLKSVFYIG